MVILDQLECMSVAEAISQPVVYNIVRSANYTATVYNAYRNPWGPENFDTVFMLLVSFKISYFSKRLTHYYCRGKIFLP